MLVLHEMLRLPPKTHILQRGTIARGTSGLSAILAAGGFWGIRYLGRVVPVEGLGTLAWDHLAPQ